MIGDRMEIKISTMDPAHFAGQVIVVNVYEDKPAVAGQAEKLDSALGGIITQLSKQGEIKGKFKEITSIFTMNKIVPARVLVVGLGKKSELTLDRIRIAAAEVSKYFRSRNGDHVPEVGFAPDIEDYAPVLLGQAISEGASLGLYSYKKHFSKKAESQGISTFNIILAQGEDSRFYQQGIETGRICAEAVKLARDLVNEPANYLTPSILADIAREQAARYGLDIQVLERDFMEKEGMGGLLGVAQGGLQPPKFIVIKYLGRNNPAIDIALVGKGITFDSGGISLKPSENMGEMKGDMAGGAAVIAAITAIAQLKPEINVTAIIPATENMPSGAAMRPGDVITQMNGKTVEIISTDAEGRLILADAISYARKAGALKIIDVATLTGSCRIALGDICTGTFGNDQTFIQKVIAAGDKAGECLWQLPLKEEYKELNKSDVADLKNSGGRNAGAISAAWFLAEFAQTTPWVHLDIAGTSMADKERDYYVKGATGIPVRSLINLVMSLAA
jgi:leucyl aminopeptidase